MNFLINIDCFIPPLPVGLCRQVFLFYVNIIRIFIFIAYTMDVRYNKYIISILEPVKKEVHMEKGKKSTCKNHTPLLIVMLTYEDQTVRNAYEIFDAYKDSDAEYWGFKEEPLPLSQMKDLYAYMKSCGKKTVLEVVAYTQAECMSGAKMAAECGCDLLMGTVYSDAVNEFCRENGIKYMPFVGEIHDRPSVLEGTCEEMILQAREYLAKGVYGIDLLGYRYTGDAARLNEEFVRAVDAPVCIAGSINGYQRLNEIRKAVPWAFTIGSAFFENKFDGNFGEQINKVCQYIKSEKIT